MERIQINESVWLDIHEDGRTLMYVFDGFQTLRTKLNSEERTKMMVAFVKAGVKN